MFTTKRSINFNLNVFLRDLYFLFSFWKFEHGFRDENVFLSADIALGKLNFFSIWNKKQILWLRKFSRHSYYYKIDLNFSIKSQEIIEVYFIIL